jgi:hypothetical protein
VPTDPPLTVAAAEVVVTVTVFVPSVVNPVATETSPVVPEAKVTFGADAVHEVFILCAYVFPKLTLISSLIAVTPVKT